MIEPGNRSIISLSSKPAIHLLLIAIAGLLAYSNTFHVPFVFDDETSIVNNHVIKDLGEFLSGAGYAYNPRRFVGYLTIALNYRLGGLDVTGYHIFNMAVHIISACLVYALVRLTLQTPFFGDLGPGTGNREPGLATQNSKLKTQNFVPLVAALLFVAHPVQTQAVTYIVQRLASLATMFYLAALVFYLKARLAFTKSEELKTQNSKLKTSLYFLLSLLSAGLAMKTKEIAFTLPFIVVLYEFSFFRMTLRKRLLFLLPVILTVLVVPLSIIGTDRPIGEIISDVTEKTRVQTGIPRLDYLFTQFRVIVTYLRLLVLPYGQNLDYDYPVYHSFFTPPVLLSFLLLLALFALAVYLYFRSRFKVQGSRFEAQNSELKTQNYLRLAAFGILWFFITLSVESSVIPIEDVLFEHRLYLPSVGAFMAVAALSAFLLRSASPQLVFVAAAAVVVILTGATFARNLVWQNELSFWSDVVRKSPGKARPHYDLALALYQRGRIDEAFDEAAIAVRMAPIEANLHNLLGSIFGMRGMYDQAIAELYAAIRLAPEQTDAHVNLGDAYRLKGLTQQALEQYFIAAKLAPNDADIFDKIGTAYERAGNMEKAAVFHQCAVSLNPSRPDYRINLQRAKAASHPSR